MISVSSDCTACGACMNICPKNCISISENEYGFKYPIINADLCIDCHACEKVCHLNIKSNSVREEQMAFAVRIKSDNTIKKSTSGGAFSALAEYVLKQKGVVYGCAYEERLKARHIRIDDVQELVKLNGSKYLQSDLGKVFTKIKDDLGENRFVLFSGTPCQVAAVKSFLGKKYDNLITVDIVCHGVSSQSFFDKYIKWYEEKNSCILEDYNFRSKRNLDWSLAGECLGKYKDSDKEYRKNIYYYNEFYYYYFLKGLTYRESCYTCKYANLDRPGDITLGDMWGAENLKLDFDIRNGCSLYIANTSKGRKLLYEANMYLKEISINQATQMNKQLINPTSKPSDYDKIIEFINNKDANEIYRCFRKTNRINRIKGIIKYRILKKIRIRFLKK